ncbi:LamG domain-containing protein [Planktothrix mougeotii]|uniref:LamG domain-containing protein n=1 Tax=Planktothrix mougeotii LEGE 06226 TaxID=1828728 RepID=A0ABR9UB10_9CYAN|nr:LamG domain-containing protein [Planktothrix mougeotii]MBE9143638.1 LamG domain-containing protein [Planktothrix mougeotii LEGE 06226]
MITHNPKSPLFRFDGNKDYADIPFKNELTPPNLTVELWVLQIEKYKYSAATLPLISTTEPQELGYTLGEYNAATGLQMIFQVDTLTERYPLFVKTPLPLNVWTHFAGTYDQKSQISCFYINGELLQTYNFTNTHYNPLKPQTPATSNILRLGALVKKSKDGKNLVFCEFNGYMDEVRIWDVARTQQQIQETINQELTGKEPNLVGYWRFSNLSDNKVPDLTGKGLDGIIIKNENPVTPIPKTQTFEADLCSQAGVNFTNTFAQEVSFKISATGAWKPASWGELPPGGWPGFEYQNQMKYPNNTSFALLVVDVETKTVLGELGSEITLVLKPSQTIAFVVNDVPISEGYTDGYKDNTGNISITCTALIP